MNFNTIGMMALQSGAVAEQIRNNAIEEMELLRRDPSTVGYSSLYATPEEVEAKRMAAEAANDMLDDCIAIIKKACNV